MSAVHRWDTFIRLMEKQCALLEDFSRDSAELRSGLHSRNWEAVEHAFTGMERLAERLEALEERRNRLADRLAAKHGTLDKGVAALEIRQRSRFLEVRSRLKVLLHGVRSRTKGLAAYADSRSRLGKELVQELVPEERGRIYDNRGRRAAGGGDPMVFSQRL